MTVERWGTSKVMQSESDNQTLSGPLIVEDECGLRWLLIDDYV